MNGSPMLKEEAYNYLPIQIMILFDSVSTAMISPILPLVVLDVFYSNALRPEVVDEAPSLTVSLQCWAIILENLFRIILLPFILDLSDKYGRKRLLLFSLFGSILANIVLVYHVSVMTVLYFRELGKIKRVLDH